MGGKRKRTVQKPTSSIVRTPPALPRQYDFTPTPTSEAIPPLLPNMNHPPSVVDYPPPKQLFLSSSMAPPPRPSPSANAQPASASQPTPTAPQRRPTATAPNLSPSLSANRPTPSHQLQRSSPQQPSHSPLSNSSRSHPSHSPRSSQAQNEDGEDDGVSHAEEPVEPTLSDQQMASLNQLLQLPRSNHVTFLDPDLRDPDSTW